MSSLWRRTMASIASVSDMINGCQKVILESREQSFSSLPSSQFSVPSHHLMMLRHLEPLAHGRLKGFGIPGWATEHFLPHTCGSMSEPVVVSFPKLHRCDPDVKAEHIVNPLTHPPSLQGNINESRQSQYLACSSSPLSQ